MAKTYRKQVLNYIDNLKMEIEHSERNIELYKRFFKNQLESIRLNKEAIKNAQKDLKTHKPNN